MKGLEERCGSGFGFKEVVCEAAFVREGCDKLAVVDVATLVGVDPIPELLELMLTECETHVPETHLCGVCGVGCKDIIVGMAALLLLFALTATSFKRIQRNMGNKWQKLHNSIYLILPLALLHFSWSQKTFWQEPVWYWMIGLILMSPRMKLWYVTYQKKSQKKSRDKNAVA